MSPGMSGCDIKPKSFTSDEFRWNCCNPWCKRIHFIFLTGVAQVRWPKHTANGVERPVQPVSMHRHVSHHTCFVYKTCIFFNRLRFPSFPNTGIGLHHCLLIQVDHFCAHKHTLFGVNRLYISAVAVGKESPLHHELNRNCNIIGGHEHAGGWKNRLVGGKMTMNGRNSHPEENLGGTFISFPCFCMYLVIWDDCI